MQYTGLKDKNGNEIYELDIVNDNGIVLFVGGRYIIKYDDERCPENSCFEDLIGDKDEVIGNIYEDPELLSGK